MKKNKKKFVLIALLFLVVFMGIGYSLLQQQLKIEGTATVKSGFDVRITGIERYNNAGTIINPAAGTPWVTTTKNAIELSEPTFTATTATFNVRLEEEASITYLLTIENKGGMPAVFDPVIVDQTGNTDVHVETLVDIDNRVLVPQESVKYLVTITHIPDTSNEPTSTVTVTFNAKQSTYVTEEKVAPTILFNENPVVMNGNIFDTYVIDVFNLNESTSVYPYLYEYVDDGELGVRVDEGTEAVVEDRGHCYFSNDGLHLYYVPPANLSSGLHTIKIAAAYEGGTGKSNVLTLKHYVY